MIHPNGYQLRRGLWGNGDPIHFGVQSLSLKANANTTMVFTNLTVNETYVLYWSSSPKEVHCLSQ
jgi:hypothetical protein